MNDTLARIHKQMSDAEDAQGRTVRIPLSGAAYVPGHFARAYEEHAARLGRRPSIMVLKAEGDGMVIASSPDDEAVARAIVDDAEAAV